MVFTDLLRALAEDRPRTMTELAAELGTDPGMLPLALEQCRRMGYLERMGLGCCDGCGSHKTCSSCSSAPASELDRGRPTGPVWWRLTASGRKAVGTLTM
jgi:hypothetical protein